MTGRSGVVRLRFRLLALPGGEVTFFGRVPSVLGLATRLGLANTTFRRNFPDICAGTAVLDAVRLELGVDVAAVTTMQIREVVERLVAAGQWKPGDPGIMVVLDAGYDAPRIAHLLDGLPVEILGRLRSDRVMRRPTPSREEFHLANPKGGRPPKHGGGFVFGDPTTWGTEKAVTATDTRLYGKATAQAWDRLHPRLTRRAAWLDHNGPLPIIEGTVIRLVVQKLPSGGVNKPVWL